MGSYSSTTMVLGQLLNLLSSILTILLTCPNSDTLLGYSNDTSSTVQYNYCSEARMLGLGTRLCYVLANLGAITTQREN